ncbi:uncharacterized protein LOC130810435 [Amaranthus tricolor]|uniref:uncharacterized protein LOC130810435 n=1 Tax=Amaranthus tricolor TaxID=29722 RepID=UPI0025910C51|nr:uncharacterized protein LOC130810435 [Amaranthus tricolor]
MAVAVLRCAVYPCTFQEKSFSVSLFLPQKYKLTRAAHHNVSYNPLMKKVIAQCGMRDKAKKQMIVVKEQLQNSLPDSVKNFPWKKAEHQALQRLLSFGGEVFKWSFIAWFFSSFLSDIIATISRNQELLVPFGLLFGCLIADFIKVTSEEVFQLKEAQGINWNFLGTACVFVVLKLISASFVNPTWIFLLHVANGGLMQILWSRFGYQVQDVKLSEDA